VVRIPYSENRPRKRIGPEISAEHQKSVQIKISAEHQKSVQIRGAEMTAAKPAKRMLALH
jgi:hypothetical protein